MSESESSVLTERDLATFLRCTPAALRRMRREGRGPRWMRVGRLIRYPRVWVQEWIEANEGSPPMPNGDQADTILPILAMTGGRNDN